MIVIALLCSQNVYASDLLEDIAKQSEGVERIDGSFIQSKFIEILSAPIISTGTFVFQRDQGVVWNTLKPIESTLNINAGGMVLLGAAETPPQFKEAAVVSRIFLSVLTGDLTQLSDYFVIEALGTLDQWQLKLTPVDENLAAYIVSIVVEGRQLTEQLIISEQNGDRTIIEVRTAEVERSNITE